MATKLTLSFRKCSRDSNHFAFPFLFTQWIPESKMCTTLKVAVTLDEHLKLTSFKIIDAHYQGPSDFSVDRNRDILGRRHSLPIQKAHPFFETYWDRHYAGKTVSQIQDYIEY